MGSQRRKKQAERRGAERQQGQTRLESILAAQEADRASARERALLGEIGQQAGVEYERGISDFQQATTGTPAAVTRLQELIRQQALPEQQRAAAQGRIALQQAGVRGPEAALMMQRQQNRMQTDLANRAEQVALQQALADRTAQQEFARQRAINAQEKAFAKGVTAEGRPQFDAAKQAKSFDTFKSLQRD